MFAGFHSARIGEGPLKWMPSSLVGGYVVQRALLGEFFSPGDLLWAHTSRTVALRDQSHSPPCVMIFSQLEMGAGRGGTTGPTRFVSCV